MIEELKTIYEGKATVIKNRQYFSAKDYISPFVERLQNYVDKFVCQVKVADQLSSDGSNVNTIYNKVLITAIFKEQYNIIINKDTYKRVVCMAYGLDIKTPICKFYSGVIDSNNIFYSFGSPGINIQKIEPETALDFSSVQTIIDTGLVDNCKAMLTQLIDVKIPASTLQNKLGEWVNFTLTKEYVNDSGKVKLSSNMAVDAYKNVHLDKDSEFYSNEPMCPILDIYKALASQISCDDKDLTNRFEKTKLINQLLGF